MIVLAQLASGTTRPRRSARNIRAAASARERHAQLTESPRARELLGLPPGVPEMQSIDEWFALVEERLDPEDAKQRRAAERI